MEQFHRSWPVFRFCPPRSCSAPPARPRRSRPPCRRSWSAPRGSCSAARCCSSFAALARRLRVGGSASAATAGRRLRGRLPGVLLRRRGRHRRGGGHRGGDRVGACVRRASGTNVRRRAPRLALGRRDGAGLRRDLPPGARRRVRRRRVGAGSGPGARLGRRLRRLRGGRQAHARRRRHARGRDGRGVRRGRRAAPAGARVRPLRRARHARWRSPRAVPRGRAHGAGLHPLRPRARAHRRQ